MSKNKVKRYLVRNLADGPRDYPLANGESIYLEPKHGEFVPEDLISKALKTAKKKGLVEINEMPEGAEDVKDNANNGEVVS